MSYKAKIIKQICLMAFFVLLALQGWRAFFTNGWNITKSFIQLQDLRSSEEVIQTENKRMLNEIKVIKKNPDWAQANKGSQEWNLVQDPSKEIIIQYTAD